jgi:hypothetical protein
MSTTSEQPSGLNREVAPLARVWMRLSLTTQGYCIGDAGRRQLWLGLRFSSGLCLTLVVVALVPQSSAMVFALAPIDLIADFSARHPFDHVWNHVVRHSAGAPALPANPTRRRHALKLATAWLLLVGALFAAGALTVALVLGGLLVAACATATAPRPICACPLTRSRGGSVTRLERT